jgi:GDP-L-fucose synthase
MKGTGSKPELWAGRKVLVTGGSGFVGSNLLPLLKSTGCQLVSPSHCDYDLTEQAEVRRMLGDHKTDLVFHLAARAGGALANREHPAEFCYANLMMGTTMIEESRRAGVRKFVTLIGACSYPEFAPSPIRETELFNAPPHQESAPYSLAKAMSAVLARSYRRQHGFNAIVLVPGNIYGPHDNFDLNNSHVIPALIRKFIDARDAGEPNVVAWGSGRPTRDFVYVEDVCRAIVIAMQNYDDGDLINLSSGRTITIRELTETVAGLVGFRGKVTWDSSKPEGQLHKVVDVTRMKELLGCECSTPLREGLRKTIEWFMANRSEARLIG